MMPRKPTSNCDHPMAQFPVEKKPMSPDEARSSDVENPHPEAESSANPAVPHIGSTSQEETTQARGSTRTIATAGLAVAIIGFAGAIIYHHLPEELSRLQLQPVAVHSPPAAPKPVVVDDAPDPADVKTRVVVIDAGAQGARPVVALAKPIGATTWEVEQQTASMLIVRELVRQALLIAARDELGLSTRDEVIDDRAPDASGREAGELSTMMRFNGTRGLFRRGGGEKAQVLWKDSLGGNPDNSNFTPKLVARAEEYSRKQFPTFLKQVGLKGEPNKVREDAPVPPEVEERLHRLGTVDAFAAVRALHAAIRADGESVARLAALSRAYALLGVLTSYQWSPAHQVFKARAMLYAERVVARESESAWALRNRAFVDALIGYHHLAIHDLDDAKELDKKAKAPAPPQVWVETIEAYLNEDVDRLAAVKGTHERLAALLRMSALQYPSGTRIGVRAARDVVKVDPDCDRAYDVICRNGDLGDLHEMTVLAPVAFGESFPAKLKALPDMPAAVVEKFQGPADEPNAVAALADAGKAGKDEGEPSWGVLAHLAREARFVQVWRRLYFMAVQWAVPVDEFWAQAGPWVADHRFLPYLETLVDPRNGFRSFSRFVDELDLNDIELTEYAMYSAIQQIGHPKGLYAWNASIRHGGAIAPNYSAVLDLKSGQKEMYARVLIQINPHSRFGMAGLIDTHWNDVKDRLPGWRAEAGDSATLLGALGKKYAELKQYKDAEDCLTRYIAKSPDRWAYQSLAGCYQAEGDDDRWKATLDEFLEKTENAGLDHARVQVQLADWFMVRDQWDEAKKYAETAAQTWAGWALLCAARANEGLHDWERAEYWYTQAAERYPSTASLPLLQFRQRTQSVFPDAEPVDPDDEKAQLAALAGSAAAIKSGEAGYIHWLNGSTRKALDVFDAAYRADPRVDLAAGLMLVADELGDVEQRDAALEDLCTKLKDKAPKTCAVCALFLATLAGEGKTPLDLSAVDAIVETIPAQSRGNTEFFVGQFLLNRGRTDDAKKYLQHCADSPTGFAWSRSIATKELRKPENVEK